eukprot:4835076-Alexandrium_andersonii.AAC.1
MPADADVAAARGPTEGWLWCPAPARRARTAVHWRSRAAPISHRLPSPPRRCAGTWVGRS